MAFLSHIFSIILIPIFAVTGFFSGGHNTPQSPVVPIVMEASTSPTTITQSKTKKIEDSQLNHTSRAVQTNVPLNPPVPTIQSAPKTSIITLPSGAVVETDANGNILRTITEAPQQTYAPPVTQVGDTAAQDKQNQINSITASCNVQINQINQQIIDLKNAYYKQLPGILSSGTSVVAQGNANLLLNQTNQKIAQLDLQIQQIQLDCQNKIYKVQ